MKLPSLDQEPTNRQARLNGWLAERGITRTHIARVLNLHPSMVGKILAGKKRPVDRIEQLAQMGIPRDLLPDPKNAGKKGS